MNNQIKVEYHEKTKKLALTSPFHLADVMREFPARRFDPKTKRWMLPLVAANIRHFEEVRHKYQFEITDPAAIALHNFETLNKGPVHVPFPLHVYKFPDPNRQPFEHQLGMLNDAWGLDAFAWFAEMGTGKTFTTIHLAIAKYLAGEIDQVCIIAPSTLRRTWLKELAKYCHIPYDYRIHDPKDAGYDRWLGVRPDRGTLRILGVSVEGLGVSENLWLSASRFLRVGRTLTVVDESSRIKNPKALRTQRAIQMGAESTIRGVLNGTPIALGLHDLWAQYEFLDPNILGTGDFYAFKARYVQLGGFENKQIVGYTHVDELMDLVKPYTTVVSKKVLNLPEKIYKTRWVEATKDQKALFKLILKGEATGKYANHFIKAENTLERMLRLRQVVGGYLPTTDPETEETTLTPLPENPKMDALMEMIEDNHVGSKFIIWSTFVAEIEEIERRLAARFGADAVRSYYGETPMDVRAQIEDSYCNVSSLRFFVGNPTAAGLGLTLISGENDVMVYYSGTSAFIDRSQSEDRAHRIGQRNSVVVMDLVMEKSVDLLIQESIAAKLDISEFVKQRLSSGASAISLLNSYHE